MPGLGLWAVVTLCTCVHTHKQHTCLLGLRPAAELAAGRPFLLSQPGPSLSSGEDGPGWQGGGGVLSQPRTLAELGGPQRPRNTVPPTHYTDGDSEGQRRRGPTRSHTNHLGLRGPLPPQHTLGCVASWPQPPPQHVPPCTPSPRFPPLIALSSPVLQY